MGYQSQAILHHPHKGARHGKSAPLRQITLRLVAFVLLLPILSALGLTKGELL
ncbi:MAG: hypothetical protein ETSY1_41545 [Candidatus Entotheonella factor]|uniref:Uncharacterized protein n=1 Tax=Entotheonella factor TaxID=1429438 RepID=W4L5F6_ENTF1|nr:MAG: hypothetical protein ETSY1_41545 [Candidatus Entotheonella factor]